MIELDVCLDSACQVVVHHDPYFKSSGQLLSVRSVAYGDGCGGMGLACLQGQCLSCSLHGTQPPNRR